MNTECRPHAKRGVKITGFVLLSLVILPLLPVLASPDGGLDWLKSGVEYQGSKALSRTPTPMPAEEVSDPPCAELPFPGEPLAAEVNGQGIRLKAFERELAQLLAALEASGEDLSSEDFQAKMQDLRSQILSLLIDDVLVQQTAVEANIAVSEQENQERVANAVALGGGILMFDAWLEETGQGWGEFSRDVCQNILYERVTDYVTVELTGTVDLVWARQILVATEKEAVVALARLASGEPFDALAEEISLDAASRDQGGNLDWFPIGFGWQPPQVEQAAFGGEPGQVQGPIEVETGYVLVQTIETQPDYVLDPDTRDALRAATFDIWLGERREVAEAVVHVDLEVAPSR